MLQHAFTPERVEIESPRERVILVCPHGLREKQRGVASSDVEAFAHCIRKDRLGNVTSLPNNGQLAQRRQSIEAQRRLPLSLVKFWLTLCGR